MALQVIPTFQGGFAPAVANFSPVNTIGQMTRGVTDAQNVAANYLMNAAREVENQKQKEALAEWLSPSARVSREALREAATAGAGGWREEWGPSNTPYAAVGRDAGKITGATPLNEGVQQAIDGTYTDPVTGEQTDASGEPVDLFGDVLAEADSERAEMGGDAIAPEVAATATPTAKQEAVNKAVQQAMATAPAAAAPRAAPAAAIAQAATPPPSVQPLPVGTDLGGGYYFDPLSPARRASAAASISAAAQQRAKMEQLDAQGRTRLEAARIRAESTKEAAKTRAAASQKARKLVTWMNPNNPKETELVPEGDYPKGRSMVPYEKPPAKEYVVWEDPDGETEILEKHQKPANPQSVPYKPRDRETVVDRRIINLQKSAHASLASLQYLTEGSVDYLRERDTALAQLKEARDLMEIRGIEVKSEEDIAREYDEELAKAAAKKAEKDKGWGIIKWFDDNFSTKKPGGAPAPQPGGGAVPGVTTRPLSTRPAGSPATPAKTAATTKEVTTTKPGKVPIYYQMPPQMEHIIGDAKKAAEYEAILRQAKEAGWNNDQIIVAFKEKGLWK